MVTRTTRAGSTRRSVRASPHRTLPNRRNPRTHSSPRRPWRRSTGTRAGRARRRRHRRSRSLSTSRTISIPHRSRQLAIRPIPTRQFPARPTRLRLCSNQDLPGLTTPSRTSPTPITTAAPTRGDRNSRECNQVPSSPELPVPRIRISNRRHHSRRAEPDGGEHCAPCQAV